VFLGKGDARAAPPVIPNTISPKGFAPQRHGNQGNLAGETIRSFWFRTSVDATLSRSFAATVPTGPIREHSKVHPLVAARLAATLHPIRAVILGLVGPGTITAFAVLHGAAMAF
jgi:hypothetical protein